MQEVYTEENYSAKVSCPENMQLPFWETTNCVGINFYSTS